MLGLPQAVCHNGGKARFNEIDLVDALPAGFERFPDRKINGLQVRFEQREVLARKATGCDWTTWVIFPRG